MCTYIHVLIKVTFLAGSAFKIEVVYSLEQDYICDSQFSPMAGTDEPSSYLNHNNIFLLPNMETFVRNSSYIFLLRIVLPWKGNKISILDMGEKMMCPALKTALSYLKCLSQCSQKSLFPNRKLHGE